MGPRRGGRRAAAAGGPRLLTAPARRIPGADGVPIAVTPFPSPPDAELGAHPPVVLVHGTAADHTTWRVVGPRLARHRVVLGMDRRGRGGSGDGPATIADGYTLDAEDRDLAAVVEAVAEDHGGAVDVVGHSYGGRLALGAALLTPALRRLVVYEGAPKPAGYRFERVGLAPELEARLAAGDPEGMLEAFFREVVGMDDAALAAYRANPVWPDRVAAAPTVPRELVAASDDAPERFAGVRQPLLLVAGTESPAVFGAGVDALAALLPQARVLRIAGAAHAAHHTHPDELVAAIEAFLDEG